MVHPCTRRASRADLGDMDLVDFVEAICCMTGEQTRQPGCEPRADHHRPSRGSGGAIEREQTLHIESRIGQRDHISPSSDGPFSNGKVHPRRRRDDHDITVEWRIDAEAVARDIRAECGEHRAEAFRPAVAQVQARNVRRSPELTSDPRAGRTGADDGDPHGSVEIWAGELAPTTLLWRGTSRAAEPDRGGEHRSESNCTESSA